MAQKKRRAAPRDADATRGRMLDAARVRFSQTSFEGVGVREIARDAGADPALVIRYFDSKEGLFRATVQHAFNAEVVLTPGDPPTAQRIARYLLGPLDEQAWRSGYDPLRLLLCSFGSPVAGPILADALEHDFFRPLANALGGKHARERAALLASHVIGFALIRLAAQSGTLRRAKMEELLTASLALCIAPG